MSWSNVETADYYHKNWEFFIYTPYDMGYYKRLLYNSNNNLIYANPQKIAATITIPRYHQNTYDEIEGEGYFGRLDAQEES